MNAEINKLIEEIERLNEIAGEWNNIYALFPDFILACCEGAPLLIEYIKAQETAIHLLRQKKDVSYCSVFLENQLDFYQKCANAVGVKGTIFADFFPDTELDERILERLAPSTENLIRTLNGVKKRCKVKPST